MTTAEHDKSLMSTAEHDKEPYDNCRTQQELYDNCRTRQEPLSLKGLMTIAEHVESLCH